MLRNWLRGALYNLMGIEDNDPRMKSIELARDYVRGEQKPQLRVKLGGADDNVVVNLSRLIVDRAAAELAGGGIELAVGEGENASDEWLEAVLDANRFPVLLYDAAVDGAITGVTFVKILIGEGELVRTDAGDFPRLVLLDPAWVEIVTAPEAWYDVTGYVITFQSTDGDGNSVNRQQRITRTEGETWEVADYVERNTGRWEQVGQVVTWPYPFAPVVHWKNLPRPRSPYGMPDITGDMILLQDKINFSVSNLQRIVRLQAHKQRYGVNIGKTDTVMMGPEDLPTLPNGGEIRQLDATADLSGALAQLAMLRQSFFAIGREVDLDSMADKLGSLTNFGLRVLYTDMLAKLEMKRTLYAEGIAELCRRLLIVGNKDVQPVEVLWNTDPVAVNEMEKTAAVVQQVGAGIMTIETAREEMGLDPEQEAERQAGERAAQQSLGELALLQFERGQ